MIMLNAGLLGRNFLIGSSYQSRPSSPAATGFAMIVSAASSHLKCVFRFSVAITAFVDGAILRPPYMGKKPTCFDDNP